MDLERHLTRIMHDLREKLVGKNFPLLIHLYLFSNDLPLKFLNFSPVVHAIFYEIQHSHSTPKVAPVCAMTSKRSPK